MTGMELIQQYYASQPSAWGELFNTGQMQEGMIREMRHQLYLYFDYNRTLGDMALVDPLMQIATYCACLADLIILQNTPDSP